MKAGCRAAAGLAAFVLCIASARAEAPGWTVEVEASRVGFTAHQMRVPVPGRFGRFEAAIRFDAEDLAGSAARIVIDMASVETPNRDIETEIKRAPWFDVARFPEAVFRSRAFVAKGGDRYDVEGELTLRGVTKPVTLQTTIDTAADPDRPAAWRAHAVGEVEVSRRAFGIGQGQWSDVAIVADAVIITIDIVARRSKQVR